MNSGIVNLQPVSNEIPSNFELYQNYPNPFNPATKIKFQLPKAGNAKIEIFDPIGRLVTTLINNTFEPGNYEIEFNGGNLSSGIYFYRLTTDNFTQIKKMILVK